MKRLYIVVEGPTEEEFVYTCLRPFFAAQEIYDVRAILLETSPGHKGGDLNYSRYKNNIENLLKRETEIIVSSLIDFFRLKTDFPEYHESLKNPDKNNQVTFLEKAIANNIPDKRFIPYIQLHEFEGLLFSDIRGFNYISNISPASHQSLINIINQHPNPELLNGGTLTAPSKRLHQLIPSYRKTLHGPIIADEIGMPSIMGKCPRFNSWISCLLEKMKN